MRRIAEGTLLIALLSAPSTPARAADIVVRHGVTYGTAEVAMPVADRTRLRLDLYMPARRTRALRPIVIAIHGGAFRSGSRSDRHIVRVSRGLARRGAVVASIDYRLLNRRPVPPAPVAQTGTTVTDTPLLRATTAAVEDTLSAIRYLRAHASRLRIDLRRLGLVGASAGAIAADHIAYVLGHSAVRGPQPRFVASLWGGVPLPVAEASGADRLPRAAPALFAVHGTADSHVPVRLSDTLVRRARRANIRTEYHRIRGRGHGFDATDFFRLRVHRRQTAFSRLLAFAASELGLERAERCRPRGVRRIPDASRRRCQYPARGAARNVITRSRRGGRSLGDT